jgi:hypothetical protein
MTDQSLANLLTSTHLAVRRGVQERGRLRRAAQHG